MTEKLLLIREQLNSIYGRFSMVINPLANFLIMFGSLCVLGNFVGFSGMASNVLVFAAVSLIGAWLPLSMRFLIVAGLGLMNLYSLSMEVTAVVAVILLLMFCLNYVFRPEKNMLVLLMPICYFLGVPYAPVLYVGLTGSLLEMLPVVFSTILYYLAVFIGKNTSLISSASTLTAMEKVTQIVKGLTDNREMWLMCIVLCMMLLITWFVGRLKADYSRYIGIGMGLVTGLLVMLIGIFAADVDVSVPLLILGLIFSGLIAAAIEFMVTPLSYLQTEYAQFEDDDYYYYVKAVPKMAISRPDIQVKKLNIRKELENTAAIPDVSGLEATNELPDVNDR